VRVVFGPCEFDSQRHTLLRHGRATPVSPRAFRLLEILLDRRPEVVSKAELLQCLWPETFVSDAGLHNLVAEVRAAIGDTPQAARFIRTVPRCGYGFHGDARPAPASDGDVVDHAHAGPHLISSRREWLLSEGPNDVGRDRDCAVSIDSPSVSRRHARIVVTGGAATIEDLGSKNGTYVNKRRVTDAVALEDGNQMRVGSVTMVFRSVGALPSTMTQRHR
jgi:DNA-binding winged helix-turn-helix (wHTH) protein